MRIHIQPVQNVFIRIMMYGVDINNNQKLAPIWYNCMSKRRFHFVCCTYINRLLDLSLVMRDFAVYEDAFRWIVELVLLCTKIAAGVWTFRRPSRKFEKSLIRFSYCTLSEPNSTACRYALENLCLNTFEVSKEKKKKKKKNVHKRNPPVVWVNTFSRFTTENKNTS